MWTKLLVVFYVSQQRIITALRIGNLGTFMTTNDVYAVTQNYLFYQKNKIHIHTLDYNVIQYYFQLLLYIRTVSEKYCIEMYNLFEVPHIITILMRYFGEYLLPKNELTKINK
jgi:hypothetical protein